MKVPVSITAKDEAVGIIACNEEEKAVEDEHHAAAEANAQV